MKNLSNAFKSGFKTGVVFGCLLVVTLTIMMVGAKASQTLSLVDEYRDGSQKVCVYSDGRNSAEVRKSLAGACPSKYIKK